MLDVNGVALAQALGEYGGASGVAQFVENGIRKSISVAIEHKWFVLGGVVGIWVFLKLIFDTN